MPAPPADEDRPLLARLRAVCARGEVHLELDFARLAHIHSPVGRETDDNLILYPAIVLTGAAWWYFGWPFGFGVAAAALAFYLSFGRRRKRLRVERRVREEALGDLALWRKLWQWGGVVLVRTGAEGPVTCRAPEQSWHRFVQEIDRSPTPACGDDDR